MSEASIKVCMVSVFPPPDCGIQHYTWRLAQLIREIDKRFEVIVIANKKPTGFLQRQTVQTENMRVLRVWRRNTLSYPLKAVRAIAKEKPNLVHVQYEYIMYGSPIFNLIFPIFLILLLLFKYRTLITMHSVVSIQNLTKSFFKRHNVPILLAYLVKNGLTILTKLISSLSTKLIVHTKSAKEILIKEYRIRANKIAIIPHGIDLYDTKTLSQKEIPKIYLQKLSGKNIILFFGYITPSKGLEHLIRAMPLILKIHPNTTLIIAGGLPVYHETGGEREYMAMLKQLVTEMRLSNSVIFTGGFVSEEITPAFFKIATVVVLPYLEDGISGASGVLMEAAKFNKAVVATRTSKFRQTIVDEINGLLADPESPEELAMAINAMLLNANLRIKVGQKLKESMSAWSWESVAKKTTELYSRLC